MNCEINVSSAKTTDREGSEKCEKFSVLTISYCAVCGYCVFIGFEFLLVLSSLFYFRFNLQNE